MDSNLRYRLLPTLSQQPLKCSHFSLPEPRAQRALLLPATYMYRRTPPTVKPTKEEVTIEMDGCIDSDRVVSSTKMKSDSDADNVPVSVSEEEEAQMESEDEEKDSKAARRGTTTSAKQFAQAPTIEGKVPVVSPPVNEEDKDKEDNDDDDNDEEDDDDDDGDKEDDDDNDDDDDDDDKEDEEDEEGIFDFDLNDVEGMSEYELMRL